MAEFESSALRRVLRSSDTNPLEPSRHMTEEEYELWKGMSKADRRVFARQLAEDKKRREDAKRAELRKTSLEASIKGGKSRGFFPELDLTTDKNPENVYDALGRKVNLENQTSFPEIDTEDDDDNGFLKRSGLVPGFQKTIDEINLKNKILESKDSIKSDPADSRVVSPPKVTKPDWMTLKQWRRLDGLPDWQKRKQIKQIEDREAKAEHLLPEPSQQNFEEEYSEDSPEALLAKQRANEILEGKYNDRINRERGQTVDVDRLSPEDAAFIANQKGIAGNTAMVAKENAKELGLRSPGHPANYIDPEVEDDFSATKEHLEGVDDQITNLFDLQKQIQEKHDKKNIPRLDQEPVPEKVKEAVEEAVEKGEVWEAVEAKEGKETGGLITLEKAEVLKDQEEKKEKKKEAVDKVLDKELKKAISTEKKDTTTSDFVRFDEAGYPIYKQGSTWGNKFRDAYNKALDNKDPKFSWVGHDGKSREYTVKQAAKTIKKAPEPTVAEKEEVKIDRSIQTKPESEDIMIAQAIPKLKEAKTEVEKEKVIQKATENLTDPEEITIKRAELKERGPDKYWIDPFTGFALNLSETERRRDRKDLIEIANTLPAADRAVYYYMNRIIDKPDFDAIVKTKRHREALDRKLKLLQIETQNYKLVSAKRNAETDPERAEHLKMWLNASSAKNYELVAYLGEKLGLDKGIMDRAKRAQIQFEMDKLSAKATKGGLKTAFSNNYGVDYSTVIANKLKWIDKATAIIQTEGVMESYNLDGKIVRDRSGRFRTYGLKEQSDMKALPYSEQLKIFERSPYKKLIMTDKRFFNNDGVFDPSILVNNKDAYEQYLSNDLVWFAMNDAYNEQYDSMMKFIAKHSYKVEKADADMAKLVTIGATIGEDGKIKPNRAGKL